LGIKAYLTAVYGVKPQQQYQHQVLNMNEMLAVLYVGVLADYVGDNIVVGIERAGCSDKRNDLKQIVYLRFFD